MTAKSGSVQIQRVATCFLFCWHLSRSLLGLEGITATKPTNTLPLLSGYLPRRWLQQYGESDCLPVTPCSVESAIWTWN